MKCFCVQENIPIEEVFENLRCTKDGLTTEAAEERLTIFGHNKLEEKKVPFFNGNPFGCLCSSFWFMFSQCFVLWLSFRRVNF